MVLDVKTEIGRDLKLINIPSLANIIINKLKAQLIKKMVLPAADDWPLPHIPKKPPQVSPPPSASLVSNSAAQQVAASKPSPTQAPSRQLKQPTHGTSTSAPALPAVHPSSNVNNKHSMANETKSAPVPERKFSPPTERKNSSTDDKKPSPPSERRPQEVPREKEMATIPPPLPARSAQKPAPPHIHPPPLPPRSSQNCASSPAGKHSVATSSPTATGSLFSGGAAASTHKEAESKGWNSTDEWYRNSIMALRDDSESESDSSEVISKKQENNKQTTNQIPKSDQRDIFGGNQNEPNDIFKNDKLGDDIFKQVPPVNNGGTKQTSASNDEKTPMAKLECNITTNNATSVTTDPLTHQIVATDFVDHQPSDASPKSTAAARDAVTNHTTTTTAQHVLKGGLTVTHINAPPSHPLGTSQKKGTSKYRNTSPMMESIESAFPYLSSSSSSSSSPHTSPSSSPPGSASLFLDTNFSPSPSSSSSSRPRSISSGGGGATSSPSASTASGDVKKASLYNLDMGSIFNQMAEQRKIVDARRSTNH